MRRRHRDDPGRHDSAAGRARRRARRQRRGCGTDPGRTGRIGSGIKGAPPLPHLRGGWARPQFSCSRNGLAPPKLHRDWAHPSPHLHRDRERACHVRAEDCAHRRRICIGTERAFTTSAAGTGPTPSSAAPGMGSPRHSCARTRARPSPHLHRDLGSPLQICAGDRAFEGGTVSVAGNERRLVFACQCCAVQYLPADVDSPVEGQMRQGRARSRCRCGVWVGDEPDPGADERLVRLSRHLDVRCRVRRRRKRRSSRRRSIVGVSLSSGLGGFACVCACVAVAVRRV